MHRRPQSRSHRSAAVCPPVLAPSRPPLLRACAVRAVPCRACVRRYSAAGAAAIPVAVKRLKPEVAANIEDVASFDQEVTILRKLRNT